MMTPSAALLVIELSATNRTLVRAVLAKLSDGIAGEIVLRRGRITEREVRMELEFRAGREDLESVFLTLCHPRITIHSYSVLGPVPVTKEPALSAVVGIPTLPPTSFPRTRVAALAH